MEGLRVKTNGSFCRTWATSSKCGAAHRVYDESHTCIANRMADEVCTVCIYQSRFLSWSGGDRSVCTRWRWRWDELAELPYTMYVPDVSHWYMIYTKSIAAISIHGNTEVIDAAALGNGSRRRRQWYLRYSKADGFAFMCTTCNCKRAMSFCKGCRSYWPAAPDACHSQIQSSSLDLLASSLPSIICKQTLTWLATAAKHHYCLHMYSTYELFWPGQRAAACRCEWPIARRWCCRFKRHAPIALCILSR